MWVWKYTDQFGAEELEDAKPMEVSSITFPYLFILMSAQTETCTTPINATTKWSRMDRGVEAHESTPVNNQQSQPIVMPQAQANWDTVLVQVVRGKPEDRWGLWPEDASHRRCSNNSAGLSRLSGRSPEEMEEA